MRHGNKLNKDKPIKVTFTPQVDRFEIRIEDQGPGVDLDTLPNPNLPENLLKPGGRGVFFMRQVMDEVRLDRTPTGSTLVLVKARKVREAQA